MGNPVCVIRKRLTSCSSAAGRKKEQQFCNGEIRQHLDQWWTVMSPIKDGGTWRAPGEQTAPSPPFLPVSGWETP